MVQSRHRLHSRFGYGRDDIAVEGPPRVVHHALRGLDAGPAHPEPEHVGAESFRECDVFAVPMPEVDCVAVGIQARTFTVGQTHPPVARGHITLGLECRPGDTPMKTTALHNVHGAYCSGVFP
jgi:hypothetical protein